MGLRAGLVAGRAGLRADEGDGGVELRAGVEAGGASLRAGDRAGGAGLLAGEEAGGVGLRAGGDAGGGGLRAGLSFSGAECRSAWGRACRLRPRGPRGPRLVTAVRSQCALPRRRGCALSAAREGLPRTGARFGTGARRPRRARQSALSTRAFLEGGQSQPSTVHGALRWPRRKWWCPQSRHAMHWSAGVVQVFQSCAPPQ